MTNYRASLTVMKVLSAKFDKARSLIGAAQQTVNELREENQRLRTELSLSQTQNAEYKQLLSGSVRKLSRRASLNPAKLERLLSTEITKKNPDDRLLEKIYSLQELLSKKHSDFFAEITTTAALHKIDSVVWNEPALCVKFALPGRKSIQLVQEFKEREEVAQVDFCMRLFK